MPSKHNPESIGAEELLGIPEKSIGAPLWANCDTRHRLKRGRETNWLDIVSSALAKTPQKRQLVQFILGDRKYVNFEVSSGHRRPELRRQFRRRVVSQQRTDE